MEYKVSRKFRDKDTREIHLPGVAFASDDAERIKDLLSRGLIEEVQLDYNSLTKKELISLLEGAGIEFDERQTKAELIKLLGGD